PCSTLICATATGSRPSSVTASSWHGTRSSPSSPAADAPPRRHLVPDDDDPDRDDRDDLLDIRVRCAREFGVEDGLGEQGDGEEDGHGHIDDPADDRHGRSRPGGHEPEDFDCGQQRQETPVAEQPAHAEVRIDECPTVVEVADVEQGRRNEGNGRQREDEDKPESRLGADLPAADIATVEVIDRPRGLLTSPEGLCGTAVEAAVAEADDDRDGGEG